MTALDYLLLVAIVVFVALAAAQVWLAVRRVRR